MRLVIDNTRSGVAQAEAAGQGSAPVQVSNPAPATSFSRPVRAPSHGQVEPQRLFSSPVAGAVNLYSPWSIHREYLP